MRLILARHGETQWNVDGLIQGANGDPLTTRGVAQARALAVALPAVQLGDLAEADAGELTGLTGVQMREQYPEFSALWDADPASAQMPGGESLLQVQERAWKAVTALGALHDETPVVAVTHDFTIHSIVCRTLDLPLRGLSSLKVDLGSITRLELSDPPYVLVSLNETGHLHTVP